MKIAVKIVLILILLLVCIGVTDAAGANTIFTDNGNNSSTVQIYPNPVLDNEFTITSDVNIAEVVIINVLGQQIYKQQVLNQNKIIIELETKEEGLYLVQIKTVDDQVITKRVLFR